MNKKKVLPILLLISGFAVSLLSGCAAGRARGQISFGVWAAEKNLWDEAIYRWKKAVQVEPHSLAAHNNLAVAYEKKGMFEEALKEYEAALKIAPKNEYVKSNYDNCKENMQSGLKEKPADKDKKNEKK